MVSRYLRRFPSPSLSDQGKTPIVAAEGAQQAGGAERHEVMPLRTIASVT